MTDGGTPPSGRAMTPEQIDALRAAFASEVAERIGPLRDAAARLAATGDAADARTVVGHAHTFATSAVILGEDLAAFHARRCEQALQPHLDAGADPVPHEAALEAAGEAETLGVLLGPWLLGAVDSDS